MTILCFSLWENPVVAVATIEQLDRIRACQVPARRAINSNAARRGPIEEYVITNVTPQPA